jgi:hypothetical protein
MSRRSKAVDGDDKACSGDNQASDSTADVLTYTYSKPRRATDGSEYTLVARVEGVFDSSAVKKQVRNCAHRIA